MGERVTTAAAYSTSAATLIAGFSMNEWAAAAGIAGVLGTLAMNWYFKYRADRRAQVEHELAVSGKLERRQKTTPALEEED
jgi:hypothetical protein